MINNGLALPGPPSPPADGAAWTPTASALRLSAPPHLVQHKSLANAHRLLPNCFWVSFEKISPTPGAHNISLNPVGGCCKEPAHCIQNRLARSWQRKCSFQGCRQKRHFLVYWTCHGSNRFAFVHYTLTGLSDVILKHFMSEKIIFSPSGITWT